jgi:hypothetical protein
LGRSWPAAGALPVAAPGTAEVLRVRLRHAEPAADGLRAWATTELPRIDLHPPALAPSAVLVVRRLHAGLPRSVAAPAAVRAPPTTGWDTELRAELASLLARAARPSDGRLPPDPPAVVFADQAELLACLVADALAGVASLRWWWEGPLREAGGADVAGLLGRRVELLPGALDLLQRWDLAVAAIQRVGVARAAGLLDALASAFALDSASRPEGVGAAGGAAAAGPAGPGRAAAPGKPGGGPAASPAQRPWERWLGPSVVPRELAPGPALLLATALLLHRAPGAARSPELATALARARLPWPPDRHPRPVGRPAEPAPAVASPAPPAAGAGRPGEPAGTPATPPDRPDWALADGVPGLAEVAGPAQSRPPGPPPGAAPAQLAGPAGPGGGEPPATALTAPAGDRGPGAGGQVPGPDQPAAAASRPPDAVPTRLAGVLYLLNLLDRLGLPDRIDRRWRVGELSGWALVEVLGRGLLDDHDRPDDGHDPLWRLLGRLDGRPPGTPVGFDLHDLELDELGPDAGPGDPGRVEAASGPLLAAVAPGTRRWLGSVTPVVRRRLAGELGLAPADAVAELRVPGLVHHSRTHVDVVMDLEAISIPVRVAGLDRDPGWVPGLGRVVAFVYARGGSG